VYSIVGVRVVPARRSTQLPTETLRNGREIADKGKK
jgi:hypothetical protein